MSYSTFLHINQSFLDKNQSEKWTENGLLLSSSRGNVTCTIFKCDIYWIFTPLCYTFNIILIFYHNFPHNSCSYGPLHHLLRLLLYLRPKVVYLLVCSRSHYRLPEVAEHRARLLLQFVAHRWQHQIRSWFWYVSPYVQCIKCFSWDSYPRRRIFQVYNPVILLVGGSLAFFLTLISLYFDFGLSTSLLLRCSPTCRFSTRNTLHCKFQRNISSFLSFFFFWQWNNYFVNPFFFLHCCLILFTRTSWCLSSTTFIHVILSPLVFLV